MQHWTMSQGSMLASVRYLQKKRGGHVLVSLADKAPLAHGDITLALKQPCTHSVLLHTPAAGCPVGIPDSLEEGFGLPFSRGPVSRGLGLDTACRASSHDAEVIKGGLGPGRRRQLAFRALWVPHHRRVCKSPKSSTCQSALLAGHTSHCAYTAAAQPSTSCVVAQLLESE